MVEMAAIIRGIKNLIRDAIPNSGDRSVSDGNHGDIPGYIA